MRSFQTLLSIGLMVLLSACGGGGGNASAPSGTTDGTAGKTIATRISAVVQNSVGGVVQSIPASGGGQVAVTLTDSTGGALVNQSVSVTEGGTSLVSFPNGLTAITDAKGVAIIKVNRKSEFKYGLGTLSVKFDAVTGCSIAGGNNCLSASTAGVDFRVSPPSLKLELLNSSGVLIDTIASSGTTTVRATLRYEDGTNVNQKRVDLSGDLTKVSFPEGNSNITTSGVALIRVGRATQSGAGTLAASAALSGVDETGTVVSTVVTGSLDYNLGVLTGPDKLTLSNLDVGTASLPAYGTRQVSVQANLGASPATAPVNISFTTSCGQILPSTSATTSSGIAVASFTATDAPGTLPSTQGCSGRSVEISAFAVGADAVRKTISILPAPATNLSFVIPTDPTKLRIYLDGSGGANSSVLQFLLSDALGAPIGSQDILLTLKTTNGGIPKASIGSKGSTSPVTLTTDSTGKVSIPVYSGTVPTNVLVNAALISNPTVQTDSSVLAIASGRPTPSHMSIAFAKYALHGTEDGDTTSVKVSLSDRQGNPVPDGTAVNFVTESGVMIPPICTTGAVPGDSQCSVILRTQGDRPNDGRVSVLAYVAGEEDFTDLNFNNVYDCGEPFTDVGTAFRDNRARVANIQTYTPGDFAVPRNASPSACGTGVTPLPTSGDGVWGSIDVRKQSVVVFSTDTVAFSNVNQTKAPDAQWNNAVVTTAFSVTIGDTLNNSLASGTTISAAAIDATTKLPTDGAAFGTCTLVALSNDAIPSSNLDALAVVVYLKDCVAGDQVKITLGGVKLNSTAKLETIFTLN